MNKKNLAAGCLIVLAAIWYPPIVEASRVGEIPEIKKDCALCHPSGSRPRKGAAPLKKSVTELCSECHTDNSGPNHHAVDIVPHMKTVLPLMKGKMTCTTCHNPHANPYGLLLRLPGDKLCMACHNV